MLDTVWHTRHLIVWIKGRPLQLAYIQAYLSSLIALQILLWIDL